MKDKYYGEYEEYVKTGDEVWYAGDIIDSVEKIIVGPSYHDVKWPNRHCYEKVNRFWNIIYFANEKDARHANCEYVAGYTDWLFGLTN